MARGDCSTFFSTDRIVWHRSIVVGDEHRKWREPARDDFLCVPACPRCHREIHAAGLVSALARHGIDVRYLLGVVADLLVEYFVERDWRADAPL